MRTDRFAETLSAWPTRSGPLHVKLSGAIEDAIRNGSILPGVRLPAERVLAHSLSLSRTTVVTAYGQLREKGWLESKTGSGTWVSRKQASGARAQAHAGVVSRGSLLSLLESNNSSTIDLAMAVTEPLGELVQEATSRAQEEIGALMRQRIAMPFGLPALRRAIAQYYIDAGVNTAPDQVLVTTGAQQAISLITSLLVHRGDPVLIETPTYFGALEVMRFAGARMSPLPVSKDHVVPSVLSRRIAAVQPRLVYLTPTGHNPSGATMPTFARQLIARDAEEHQVPIIEDDSLGDLILKGVKPPSISSYSATAPILTIGSLSKLVCCGLRVGWIRGPVALINRLARLKSAADLGSSHISQAIATELLPHVAKMRAARSAELRKKRDLVVELIRSRGLPWSFPEPQGGMSLWVKLGDCTDTQILAQLALRHGVSIVPGSLFSVDEAHAEYLRLPFLLAPEVLTAGVEGVMDSWSELGASHGACSPGRVLV